MAKQRYINTKFWSDSFVSELNSLDRYLFLYFLTNEHTNISGIYEVPLKTIAFETGIEIEMLQKMIKRLESKIKYIDGWVCIKNFQKHQSTESEKVKRGIEIEMEKIPLNIRKKIPYRYPIDTPRRPIIYSNSNSNSNNKDFTTVKSSLKKPMKKNSFKYNENQHTDTFESVIDLDTGEYKNETKKLPKNKTAIKILGIFGEMCEEKIKVKPAIAKGNYFVVLKAMKELETPDRVVDCLEDWFKSGKEKADLIQITQALSINNMNRFKTK